MIKDSLLCLIKMGFAKCDATLSLRRESLQLPGKTSKVLARRIAKLKS
jgi:hypothetical protein